MVIIINIRAYGGLWKVAENVIDAFINIKPQCQHMCGLEKRVFKCTVMMNKIGRINIVMILLYSINNRNSMTHIETCLNETLRKSMKRVYIEHHV